MKKSKKILSLVLAVAMVMVLCIGATTAYLTDTEDEINVMTLGNVKIEQQEWQRADGVNYNNNGEPATESDLVPFVQGQTILPAVPLTSGAYSAELDKANGFQWGDYVTAEGAWNGLWNENKIANVMDKIVMVKNTGKTDAYYRTVFLFECPEGMTYGPNSNCDFMINMNSKFDNATVGYATIDGTRYMIQVATYKDVLTPGETSRPSLLQVLMTDHVTNEQVALLGDTYDILVLSQAVQTQGFDDAQTALDTAFGEVNAINAATWFGGVKVPTVVSTADELADALAAGKDVVLSNDVTVSEDTSILVQGDVVIDLAGKTLTMTASDNSSAAKKISVFTVANGQTLTIEGGEFVVNFDKNGTDYTNGNKQNNLFNVENGGKLVINDGTFTATMVEDGYNLVPVIIDNNGEVVINGGSFSTNAMNLFRNTNGKMTINGGTFSGATYPQNKEKYPCSVIWNQCANSELTVNGGTFTNLEVEKEAGTVTIANGIDLPLWKTLSER